jgi:hypothetical protein
MPPHLTARRSILILSSHLRLGLPSGLLASGFTIKTLYAPLLSYKRAILPAHLSLLHLTTRIIFCEEYSTSLQPTNPNRDTRLGPRTHCSNGKHAYNRSVWIAPFSSQSNAVFPCPPPPHCVMRQRAVSVTWQCWQLSVSRKCVQEALPWWGWYPE